MTRSMRAAIPVVGLLLLGGCEVTPAVAVSPPVAATVATPAPPVVVQTAPAPPTVVQTAPPPTVVAPY
jgi:hypothetical protein